MPEKNWIPMASLAPSPSSYVSMALDIFAASPAGLFPGSSYQPMSCRISAAYHALRIFLDSRELTLT